MSVNLCVWFVLHEEFVKLGKFVCGCVCVCVCVCVSVHM